MSPANDFAHLSPSKINFKTGGYITGIIGIMIFPWKLIADPSGYIFKWLIAYSSLLGPIGGIMIADYFFLRKKQLTLTALYQNSGKYFYNNGINNVAIIALLAGIMPNIPGFLININIISSQLLPEWIGGLYNYAWFVGFGMSGGIYYLLSDKNGEYN